MAIDLPIIGFDNHLETFGVTVTSELGGNPKENLHDWRPYTLFKSRLALPFTSGGTYVTLVGDLIEGATSAATAIVKAITIDSGSFAGGNAVGTFFIETQTGTFQSENLDVGANLNVATIAGDSAPGTILIIIDKLAGGIDTDLFGILRHNLGTAGTTLKVYDNTTGVIAGATLLFTKVFSGASDDIIFMDDFTAGTQRFNIIELTLSTVIPFIGVLFVGKKLEMFRNPIQGYDIHSQQTFGELFVSQAGQKLANAIRFTNRRLLAEFEDLPETFVRNTLLPFMENHYLDGKPFFWKHDVISPSTRVYFISGPTDPELTLPYFVNSHQFFLIAEGLKQDET